MNQYQDYGYYSNKACHVQAYILYPIESLLDKTKNTKILDIGCGNGWLVNHLIAKGFDAYGIDASASGIKIANQQNPNRFFLQDVSKNDLPIEIKDISFDTIISTEVIEHLYDPITYFDFCYQVLKKNGHGEILLTTPYHGYLKNLILSLSGKMDNHFTAEWVGGHIKFWSKKTLNSVLIKSGFRIQTFIGCGRIPFLWKSMLIKATL